MGLELLENHMRTILYITTTLKRTGPVNILLDLIKYLDRAVYGNIHVLTLCPEESDTRWRDFEAEGVSVSSLNLSKGIGFIASAWCLRRSSDAIKPDVVHCIGFRADVLAAIFLSPYPKVSSQLNYPFDDYIMTYGRVIGNSMAYMTAWALKRYDCTVACAKDVSTKMARHGVSAKVIYNAIDDARFVPFCLSERAELRKRLNLWDDADLVFIFVGVLIDRKQPLVALDAFLLLQDCMPKAAMIVLGDGPLLGACQRLASGRRVHFAGNVPDTYPYLAASDAYIATSKAEGMPVSVIEALALRLPVVLSDINPHREILSIDDGAGFLARTGSVESTLDAMSKLADSNLVAMGDHARWIIDLELSARIMSRKFQELYGTLIR